LYAKALRPILSLTQYNYAVIATGVGMVLVGVAMMVFGGREEPAPLAAPSTGDLENAIIQLNKNHELLRRQTTQGFLLACAFMSLGLLVILAGSVGDLFGLTQESNRLAIVAGILTEFISATGLAVYALNFRRLNLTHDRLHESWKILAAFKQAKDLPEDRRSEVLVSLVEALVAVPAKKPAARRRSAKKKATTVEGEGGDGVKRIPPAAGG
jgi:hypothetical protein